MSYFEDKRLVYGLIGGAAMLIGAYILSSSSNDQLDGFVRTKADSKDLKKVYQIDLKILGKGSFGTVFKGTNKSNPDL